MPNDCRYKFSDFVRGIGAGLERRLRADAYRAYFDPENDDDPGISGIALAVDTQKAGDGGRASAFVREIRFYR